NAARGAAVFGQCAACHSIEPGVHLTGPSLARVWGRRAGTVEGFSRYSEPFMRATVVWDATTLDRWVEDPQAVVPQDLMPFPGQAGAGAGGHAGRPDVHRVRLAAGDRSHGGSEVPMTRSRRDFLLTLAGLGTGAAAASVGTHLIGRRDIASAGTDGARTIHLEAREVSWELAPGKTVKAMAYNGQVPGPEIRAREGERLRITLKNSLAEPTTIHWHGLDVPNAMDGVPGLTQEPVQPGVRSHTNSRRGRRAPVGITRTSTSTARWISVSPRRSSSSRRRRSQWHTTARSRWFSTIGRRAPADRFPRRTPA